MENIKDISIKSYLSQRDITPKMERGGVGMYLSPFRAETTPSFKVDYNKNLWYDFGIGEGGSIIDLVMRLDGLSFHQAATKLEQGDFSSSHWTPPTAQTTSTPKTEIISTDTIKNRHLIAYLEKRAINLDIAQKYCREVHYLQNGKQYFAIGFQSEGGGWELRNPYYKGSTSPKAPTIIKGSTNSTMLFEGFMDMLAYLTLIEVVTPENNVCVLNSVSNLRQAVEFLKSQQEIDRLHKTISKILDLVPEMMSHLKFTQLCKTIGFGIEMIRQLINGDEVRFNGDLYSDLHNKRFHTDGSVAKRHQSNDRTENAKLLIDNKPHDEWFREQYQKQAQTIEPQQRRGRRM